MDVIDLNKVRNDREAPDAECVTNDGFGRPMYQFGVEYELDGSEWTMSIWAYSLEDAQRRVAAIRDTATVYGQIFGVIPA